MVQINGEILNSQKTLNFSASWESYVVSFGILKLSIDICISFLFAKYSSGIT